MRYLDAMLASVTADEAIAECKRHQIAAHIRDTDHALVETETGDLIALADDAGEYCGEAVISFLGY